MVKRCSKYIFYWVKKRIVWDVLDIEEIRDNDNETGLKEGGVNRNVNLQVLSIYAIALALFRL